jgi:hypothetical protein
MPKPTSRIFLNDLYEFRVNQLENDLVEIRIVMPNPNPIPCDKKGPEARKRLTKFILASASGLASILRINLEDKLGAIYETVAESVDTEQKMQIILEKIHASPGAYTVQDLISNPPDNVDSRQAQIIIQYLLDNQDLVLDDSQLVWVESS